MTICLIPQLSRLGWTFRFRFDLTHPAVRKGARLGVWALGYAGGYQAGLIVVLMLANKVEGGVAAYQWAYTFFYLPHALFAIPIFHVLFTAMAEHAARDEPTELMDRLRDGLGMLAFLLIPLAALIFVAAGPITRLTLQYGVMTGAGAEQVATVLAAFALGLPSYSAFLVLTRAFYASGDVKTPALVNAASVMVTSVIGTALFFMLSDGNGVVGLALGHSIGFTVGAIVLGRLLSRARGSLGGPRLNAAIARALAGSLVVAALMFAISKALPDDDKVALLINVLVTSIAGGVAYLAGMRVLRSPELARVARLMPRAGR